MKTILYKDPVNNGITDLRHKQVTMTGAKRHPVVFHSRKRYAEAEEEE